MKKIVIIGGGFAGSLIAKKLEKEKFEVILIDTKNYFEFTPSILRTIVEPQHIKKIQVIHSHYLHKTRVIVGEVKEISKEKVKVRYPNNSKKTIDFDYLVIASGSSYNLPMKEKNVVISTRANVLRDCYEKLCKSKEILIIGGGLVGVELAAEIIDHYGKENKKITMVHANKDLIERNDKKAIKYAEKFLRKNRVNLIFNEIVMKSDKKGIFITNRGRKIKTDMAFLCTGIKPNFEFLKRNFSSILNEKNQISVNSYLQVKGNKNIFSAGEITSIKEEKTAQNAEYQARVVVRNILNLEKKLPLKKYVSQPRVMVISLGKKNGILTYKNFIFTGIIPGFLKGFIEWETMKKYR